MSRKYKHILSPLKIGNVVLKSRLLSANALPHFLQGPELYPSDAVVDYLVGIAKNGAAIVTIGDWTNLKQREGFGDGCHFPMWDTRDPALENAMTLMVDQIHFYGAKVIGATHLNAPAGYGVYDGEPSGMPMMSPEEMEEMMEDMQEMMGGDGAPMPFGPPPGHDGPIKAMGIEQMEQYIKELVDKMRYYKGVGYDGASIHASYGATLLSKFLSPKYNKRTDEFGGPMANRSKFPIMVAKAMKEAFGQDFIVEMQVSGEEDDGLTVEDIVEFAKLAEGYIDILQLRAGDGDLAHPTGFNSQPHDPLTIRFAEAIRKSGAKIITAPIGGFQDLDDIEEYIASGKTDMIGFGRAFICDSDYGQKILDGRGEDVVPCVRCNRCHGLGMQGPWKSVCTVNPLVGIQHKLNALVPASTTPKKVAVIGGGCAGMRCALYLTERGHQVTLFEKSDKLGGQLLHADYSSFKWPLRDYKDYLIAQLRKSAVDVKMNTEATPAMIAEGEYDAVIAALGATPKFPPIPGLMNAEGSPIPGVYDPIEVYGREQELGKNVVVIGGGEIGMETAMYLAENGHDVTILSRQKKFAAEADRVHYYSMFADAWKKMPNLTPIKRATTTAVAPGEVIYTDKNGESHTLSCDSIVACGGMQAAQDEALPFADVVDTFIIIGDNEGSGNVMTATRSAYAAAMRI
ncbi:MAG: FAD-dependent oxidoreductase [Oscillospiraceae bacterium]|nr:FAD-dependent oxidoreductase [Oscillospiraceae bacterium]